MTVRAGETLYGISHRYGLAFADVAAWRAWTMTTGQRMFWGRMDDEQRADVLARAEQLLEDARGRDGRVVVRQDVRYTLARA